MSNIGATIEHHYGPNVHLLDNPYLTTMLSSLGSPDTLQPRVNQLVEFLYSGLTTAVICNEFAQKNVQLPTRMTELHPDQLFKGAIVDDEQKVVVTNLARAGILPSYITYQALNFIINPLNVRQDHIMASRSTNEKDQVTGTELPAAKIGGPIENSIVMIPDPMGATGNTLVSIVNHYKNHVEGNAKKFIAVHLIVTPEYLKNVTTNAPDLQVYAIRLDRGLSGEEVLNSAPGTHWEKERGLNDKHYIVPGAGGLGEVMNNSYV